VPVSLQNNYIYWPTVSGVSTVGPEIASSGSFQMAHALVAFNTFAVTPSGGGVYFNTNGDGQSTGYNNYNASNQLIGPNSSPTLFDSGYGTTSSVYGLSTQPGYAGSQANALVAWDSNGFNGVKASFPDVEQALTCSDVSGSGTAQSCATNPEYDYTGTTIAPVTGNYMLYQTTTANTGDLTIALNGGSAVHVRKDGGNSILSAKDIKANIAYPLVFDGTYWELGPDAFTATMLGTGTSVSLTAPTQDYVCTSTCTVTPPVPAPGYKFCIYNDDNTATVITLAALGSSARYENTARTAYGTAGTGTFVSGGAAADAVCIEGRYSTHYLTTSFHGTWTAN
jgi:hypothetical protein